MTGAHSTRPTEFSRRLRLALDLSGASVRRTAAELDVSHATLSLWLSGKSAPRPTDRTKLRRLGAYLDADAEQIARWLREPASLPSPQRLFLRGLVDEHQYLEMKGMGVNDRVAVRLPLLSLFVPLKARPGLAGRDGRRGAPRVAGQTLSSSEADAVNEQVGEPVPVEDLLEAHDGVIVLGDPGSGKTTLLKFLALQHATAGDTARVTRARLPLLTPLVAYASALSSEPRLALEDFLVAYHRRPGGDVPVREVITKALAAGEALVLLDGLDEVGDPASRDTATERVAAFFEAHRGGGNKFVMTSRIVGYRRPEPPAEGLAECILTNFDDDDVAAFVEKWTLAVEREARGASPIADRAAAAQRAELHRAITQNPGVRVMAANPLMLTILVLLKRSGVALPDRRVELYEHYVQTLLGSWNRARSLARTVSQPPASRRALDVVETVQVLAPLALSLHRENPRVGLIDGATLTTTLRGIFEMRGEADPGRAATRFIDDVGDYAGLLVERGPGQYGFMHLTFQEYLAAVGVADKEQEGLDQVVDFLAGRLPQPLWREVTLLTIGYLAIVLKHGRFAERVIARLIGDGTDGGAVALMGEAVADVAPGGLRPGYISTLRRRLLETMRDADTVEATVRARAGTALGRLGDPRFRADAWFLPGQDAHEKAEPLLGLVEIPAGEFLMGSDPGDDDQAPEWALEREEPRREVTLPAYYIARYPVTVAQFQAFVEDDPQLEPADPDRLRGGATHPVVRVSWQEARAYCDWLTGRLRAWDETPEPLSGLLRSGWEVTLPSEAEWEKAARGTEGRRYPWGPAFDKNLANSHETGIGEPTAVGCFSGGATPEPAGVEELAGNVWEWTRSAWREDYRNGADDGLASLEEKHAPRVVRGGSCLRSRGYVRSASRYGYDPDYRLRSFGFRVVVSPFQADL